MYLFFLQGTWLLVALQHMPSSASSGSIWMNLKPKWDGNSQDGCVFFFSLHMFCKHVCLWRSRDWQHQKLNLWIYLQPRYISDRCSHSQTALPMTLTPVWKDNLIYYKEERWFSLQPCWQSLGALWTQFVICVETSNRLVTWTIFH